LGTIGSWPVLSPLDIGSHWEELGAMGEGCFDPRATPIQVVQGVSGLREFCDGYEEAQARVPVPHEHERPAESVKDSAVPVIQRRGEQKGTQPRAAVPHEPEWYGRSHSHMSMSERPRREGEGRTGKSACAPHESGAEAGTPAEGGCATSGNSQRKIYELKAAISGKRGQITCWNEKGQSRT
jgi:hypothetical protein